MLKKIYMGLGGLLILSYASYSVMGLHAFGTSKDKVPTVRVNSSNSSSGYGGRSRTGFWGGGGGGGGFSFGK